MYIVTQKTKTTVVRFIPTSTREDNNQYKKHTQTQQRQNQID
jgi:hypothetical protein